MATAEPRGRIGRALGGLSRAFGRAGASPAASGARLPWENTLHFVSFRDRPLLYGRVPKVANTSVKAALGKLLASKPVDGPQMKSDAFWREHTGGETEMLSPADAFAQRGEKFCFAFVRNPFDRLVSCYNNKILIEPALPPLMRATGYRTNMSFRDFLARTAEIPDAELDVHAMPQSAMLLHEGALVPEFVGHFEDIERQWTRLRHKLELRHGIRLKPLPTKNVRREDRDDVRRYFATDEVIGLALTKYARDLELFYPGVAVDALLSGDFRPPEVARPPRPEGGA